MNTDKEKDFELMLARLIRAIAKSSPMCPNVLRVMAQAEDLLKRKGTASPLKSDPCPFVSIRG